MKILMAARRYPPDVYSGTETVFANLYQRAREHHDVRLVTGWVRSRELVPAEAVAVPLKGRSKLRAWSAMSQAIFSEARRFKPDVILSNSIEVPPTGFPTTCIVHDLNFGRAASGLSAKLKSSFYARRARSLDAVITVSGASARALVAAGVPEGRIRVVHNGVDVDYFKPIPPREDDGIVRFAYPSRILPGKGQHLAIDAIARLPALYKRKAHLTIVGAIADPVYLDQLRVQSFRQPVEFAFDVPEIGPYYQNADVIVYPTVMEEGFGFTAVEGMSCGKPVIWFDQPAIREATGGIGFPIDREDVVGMRDAMVALITDPEKRRRVGDAGRRYAENNLSWRRVWEQYETALSSIAR
ncbi:MAG: glycosyltransferase involved in cell wall biosynthesis [Myxococcota bacterium]|jgi:glycosyltransferase involved in cell wall biosynthesis